MLPNRSRMIARHLRGPLDRGTRENG
jgi:hypothetical protein